MQSFFRFSEAPIAEADRGSHEHRDQAGENEAAKQHRPIPGVETQKPTVTGEAHCGEPQHRNEPCVLVLWSAWSLVCLLFSLVVFSNALDRHRQSVLASVSNGRLARGMAFGCCAGATVANNRRLTRVAFAGHFSGLRKPSGPAARRNFALRVGSERSA